MPKKNVLEPKLLAEIRTEVRRHLGVTHETIAELRKLGEVLDSWSTTDEQRFELVLESLWSSEGENDVTVRGRGPLNNLFDRAHWKFMEVNKRGDVQARYRLDLLLPSKMRITLPRRIYECYEYQNNKPAV